MSQIPQHPAVEAELARRAAHRAALAGQPTPFRAEFRYSGDKTCWVYFTTPEDAAAAEDSTCRISRDTGEVFVEQPLGKEIQKADECGNWQPYEIKEKV